MLERTTSYSVSFMQWTSTGIVLAAAHVPICYLILKWMLPPEVQSLPDRRSHVRRQREQLGPLSRGEKNVLLALTVMLVLWMLPTVVEMEFLDIWYAPPVAMVLLFLLPVDAKRGQMTLEGRDFQEGVAWNVLFLVVGGMALASALTRLGVTDWIGGRVYAERRGDGAALAGWSAVDDADATGQRHRDDDNGLLTAVSDRRGGRIQRRGSRPDRRRHGPCADAALVQPHGGGDVRRGCCRVRHDVQNGGGGPPF